MCRYRGCARWPAPLPCRGFQRVACRGYVAADRAGEEIQVFPWAVSELLLSRAVQLPSVHPSDAEPGPDPFPRHPLLSRRRPFAAISVDAGQELPLTLRIAPGVCLEPPAAHRLHQRRQVALRAPARRPYPGPGRIAATRHHRRWPLVRPGPPRAYTPGQARSWAAWPAARSSASLPRIGVSSSINAATDKPDAYRDETPIIFGRVLGAPRQPGPSIRTLAKLTSFGSQTGSQQ
jgi:hypothetical protein